jgi:hypothetical protein
MEGEHQIKSLDDNGVVIRDYTTPTEYEWTHGYAPNYDIVDKAYNEGR